MSRALHFYGLGYRELLSIPMRVFWELNNSVHRIQADRDLRELTLRVNVRSDEGVKKLDETLKKQLNAPIKARPGRFAQRDEEGFERLRRIGGG